MSILKEIVPEERSLTLPLLFYLLTHITDMHLVFTYFLNGNEMNETRGHEEEKEERKEEQKGKL